MTAANAISNARGKRLALLAHSVRGVGSFAIALSLCATLAGAEPDSLGVIHIAYSGRMLTNINKKDAEVAVGIWAKQGIVALDMVAQPEIAFYDGWQEVLTAIEREQVDLVSMSVLEYLALREHLEPVLVSQIGERPDGRRLLLVHRDRQWQDLADLRGGYLVAEAGLSATESLSLIWFNNELQKAGLYDREQPFLRRRQTVNKTMAAVLPVAFKQADAALVYGPNFATIAELNPQLKRELVALRSSPHMLPVITCIPHYVPESRRQKLVHIMLHIDQTPQGKQLMTLFGINGVQPFSPELLESVEQLIAERDSLFARSIPEKPRHD